MTEKELTDITLATAAKRIKSGDLSPIELTELMLARIKRLNPELVAYGTIAYEEALADARAAEREIRTGQYRGALHGIPLSIKDNIATRGIRTTAGSKVLKDYVPDYDATVVARLKEAGAVILGKSNMHEWANGGTTINPFYGTTRNPWDTERIAGGSSGGSAAGLAASLSLGSIGTDNGGSVRNPASLCGVVGFKPTYGRVSRFGHIPENGGFSTNHLGVFSKTVRDCALILGTVAGSDPNDPNSAEQPVPHYEEGLEEDIQGLRVGIIRDYFDRYMTNTVRDAFAEAQRQLGSLGAELVEVEVPHLEATRVAWPCITRPENVVENLPYLTTQPRDYSPRLLHQNISALLIPADAYVIAQQVRRLLCQEFDNVFDEVDIIATPTAAVPAPTIEESKQTTMKVDGQEIKLESPGVNFRSLFTTPFNLTGLPALSINCGFSSGGLPIGLQLVGPRFGEEPVLRAAHAYEQAAKWFRRKPLIGG